MRIAIPIHSFEPEGVERFEGGLPAFQLSSRCGFLRRGFSNGYVLVLTPFSNKTARLAPKPLKNQYSQVHDAGQVSQSQPDPAGSDGGGWAGAVALRAAAHGRVQDRLRQQFVRFEGECLMNFVPKALVVSAVQYLGIGGDGKALFGSLGPEGEPEWLTTAMALPKGDPGSIHLDARYNPVRLIIATEAEHVSALPGDWAVRQPDETMMKLADGAFQQIYEEARHGTSINWLVGRSDVRQQEGTAAGRAAAGRSPAATHGSPRRTAASAWSG